MLMLDAVLLAHLLRLVAVPRANFRLRALFGHGLLPPFPKKAHDKYFAQLFVTIRDN
jgi:hypothetical protein